MRITRPCAGDDPFKIEALEQHELLLSDMSLAPPDSAGKCRRLYNRLGAHCCPSASGTPGSLAWHSPWTCSGFEQHASSATPQLSKFAPSLGQQCQ